MNKVLLSGALILVCVGFAGCGNDETSASQDDQRLLDFEGPATEPTGRLILSDDVENTASQQTDGLSDVTADRGAIDIDSKMLDACTRIDDESTVVRRLYLDSDESERSIFTGGPEDHEGVWDGALELIGADSSDYTMTRCPEGHVVYTGLTDGTYLMRAYLEDDIRCTTANCPSRFADAVAEGRPVKVLTVGDSICVIGDDELFPSKFKQLFQGLAQIDVINGCRAGSTSPEWVPGTPLFRQALSPHIASSDLLVISLGGNDILAFVNQYVQSVGVPSDIDGAVNMARGVVDNVIANIRTMIVEARNLNPSVDIVYLLYLDYSRARNNRLWQYVVAFLGEQAVGDVLAAARNHFPRDIPNLMLVDLFGLSQDLDVDDYLYDELHMNALGHTLYAEALFETLGGIRLGSNPLGDGSRIPLGRYAPIGVSSPRP